MGWRREWRVRITQLTVRDERGPASGRVRLSEDAWVTEDPV